MTLVLLGCVGHYRSSFSTAQGFEVGIHRQEHQLRFVLNAYLVVQIHSLMDVYTNLSVETVDASLNLGKLMADDPLRVVGNCVLIQILSGFTNF